MGAIPSKKSLALCDKLSTSSFCRRRLSVIMVRLKMAETLREAVTFIEQGHVRVGPETVSDPAYLVTRNFEDFVTWVDTSKIKRKVAAYNDKLSTSSFCRRRLSVIMVRLKMAETLREAVTFIEQGHVRAGPETVSDPAYLVTRNFEDFVTW